MKRIAIKLVVFLLIGAVVNVAVAWGCAYLPMDSESTVAERQMSGVLRLGDEVACFVIGAARPGAAQYLAEWGLEEDWKRHAGIEYPEEPPGWILGVIVEQWRVCRDSNELLIEARGWPLLALRYHIDYYNSFAPIGGWQMSRRDGLDWPPRNILPLRPIWPGFIINTAFYATILWLLWSTPFATRRLIRKRRGRCVRCGYDLRHAEHEVCPECGA